jgi:hypothetical protein
MIEIIANLLTAHLGMLIGGALGFGAAYLAWTLLPMSMDRATIGAILVVDGFLAGFGVEVWLDKRHPR